MMHQGPRGTLAVIGGYLRLLLREVAAIALFHDVRVHVGVLPADLNL